jgi:hypothetical protein
VVLRGLHDLRLPAWTRVTGRLQFDPTNKHS